MQLALPSASTPSEGWLPLPAWPCRPDHFPGGGSRPYPFRPPAGPMRSSSKRVWNGGLIIIIIISFILTTNCFVVVINWFGAAGQMGGWNNTVKSSYLHTLYNYCPLEGF